MINYANVSFVKSVSKYDEAPGNKMPEVLLCGKSNVGKSSLLNAIVERKSLAFTSSKPGHTKLLNYFNVDNSYYLVDSPGYGYAKGGIDLDKLFKELMDDYFAKSTSLKIVIFLLNSERTLSDTDEEFLKYLQDKNLPYKVVFTKVDKLNQKGLSALNKYAKELNIEDPLLVSNKSNKSLSILRKVIESYIK